MDPEFLNGQVSKYAKFVTQLEKGLPPNSVVPQLKSKVEKMKEKVSLDEIISETPGQSVTTYSSYYLPKPGILPCLNYLCREKKQQTNSVTAEAQTASFSLAGQIMQLNSMRILVVSHPH